MSTEFRLYKFKIDDKDVDFTLTPYRIKSLLSNNGTDWHSIMKCSNITDYSIWYNSKKSQHELIFNVDEDVAMTLMMHAGELHSTW